MLASIAYSAALLTVSLTSAAFAVSTTVVWNGDNSFNDETMTFSGFWANQLTDITGSGRYEACCKDGATSFKLELRIGQGKNKQWETILSWTTTGDEVTHLLGDLVGPVIKFSDKPVYVSGIKLESSPNGKVEWGKGPDPNFTNFNFITFLSRDEYYEKYKSKYPNRQAFDDCDDYEKYIRNLTSFVFDTSASSTTGNAAVPLPAALPLMGSVLSGAGFAMWRRRRKKSA